MPTLRLASRFLTEESLWPFWFQMIDNRRHTPEASAGRGYLEQFDVTPGRVLTDGEIKKMKNFITALERPGRIFFDFFDFFGDPTLGKHATTTRGRVASGLRGVKPVIHFDLGFQDHLLRNPSAKLAGMTHFDIQFFIAKVLMHQLNHAFYILCCRNKREPFFSDQAVAELGRAWESWVFGGEVSSPLRTEDSPCGITLITPWPNCDSGDEDPTSKIVPVPMRGDTPDHRTCWLVPQDYIRCLQSERFWNVEVPAKGLAAFRVSQRVGVKEWISVARGNRPKEKLWVIDHDGCPSDEFVLEPKKHWWPLTD